MITDPREFDGNPYEVAARAVAQAEATAKLLAWTVQAARLMARNAEMERQLLDGDPSAAAFENGPHGTRFDKVVEDVREVERDLRLLGRAAGFDPKAPLGRA